MAGKGKIQGITIEFAADSSGLTKALKEADKAASDAQKSIRQIDKALKLDPSNVTLLKQKQTELNKVIDATQKELDGFNTELKAMDAAGVEKTDERYMALQRNIIKAENDLKGFNDELKKTNAQASNLGQLGAKFEAVGGKISAMGQQMQVVSGIAAGVVASIGAISYSTAVWADDLNTLSKVTGISTEQLQIYAAAAELVDVDVSTIAKSVARMKKNMLTASQGTGTAAEAFKALGVEVTNADGSLRDQDAVFQEALKALGSMSNETERDAYAMAIFGKSAAELNPLIEDMGQTYKMVADEFAKGGLDPLDQETLDKANEFNDDVDMMKMKLDQAKKILGAGLADAFGDDVEKLSEWVGKLAEKIAGLNPNVLKVITIIAGVVAVIAPLLTIIGFMVTNIGGLFKVLSGLGPLLAKLGTMCDAFFTMLAANPIMVVVIAVTALVIAVVKAYKEGGKFKEMCDRLWAAIKKLGSGIASFAKNAVAKIKSVFSSVKSIGQNIVTGLWNGISNKFQWLISKIKGFCNNVKDKLKSFFGIKSPSKWARDMIGKNIARGIGVGFDASMSAVTSDMKSTVAKAQDSMAVAQPTATDRLNNTLSTLASGSNSTNSTNYTFGNITIDASSLQDIATVEDFALMLKRAKAFA